MTRTGEEEPQSGELTEHNMDQFLRERIEHVLMIYPRVSTSMLQVGLGTSMPPTMWRPTFNRMLEEKKLIEDRASFKTPTGRNQTYTIIRLNPEYYPGVPLMTTTDLAEATTEVGSSSSTVAA